MTEDLMEKALIKLESKSISEIQTSHMMVQTIGETDKGNPHSNCSSYVLFSSDEPIPDFRITRENNGKAYISTTEVVIALRYGVDEDVPVLHSKLSQLLHNFKL